MLENGTPIDMMLALLVVEDELLDRLLKRGKISGRPDDKDPEKIRNRFTVYQRETTPVAEYYKAHGKLHNIEGVGEIDAIFARLTRTIEANV